MDSIFEEETEEVGAEIEAYCPSPRCKADVTHTVVSVFEGEVRRVQCSVCGDVHAFRKPRGDAAEEASEAVPKRALIKRGTWDESIARTPDAELANCRPYSIRDTYEEADMLHHPSFDIGFVVELMPDNKIEVLFKEGPRVLVHNRVDLAARMPELSDIPAPREAKKKKRGNKAEGPLRAKADVAKAIETARMAAHAKVVEANKRKKPTKKPAKPVATAKVAKPTKAAKPVKAVTKKAVPKKVSKSAAKKAPAKKPAKAVAKKAAKPAVKSSAKKPAKKAKKH